ALAERTARATSCRAGPAPRRTLSPAGRIGGVATTERIMTRGQRARRRHGTALGIVLLALLPAARIFAHGLDPASLALRETLPGVFEVVWRVSALRLPGADVRPALPSRCHQVGAAQALDGADRIVLRWTIDCGPSDLAGETIGIDDLAAAKIN